MTKFFLTTASIVFCALVASPALAEEKKEPAAPIAKIGTAAKENIKPAPAPVKKKTPTPVDEWVEAENAMIENLSGEDQTTVFILRNKHSVIRAIDVVKGDIGEAVKACGKENPAMKDKMENRFKQWQDAVNPITKTAQKNLNDSIDSQKIVKPSEFKRVLKLNDKAFEYGDKMTVKTPVSSESACNNLLKSMDRTEDGMVKLLRQSLLPESVIKSRVEKDAKDTKK